MGVFRRVDGISSPRDGHEGEAPFFGDVVVRDGTCFRTVTWECVPGQEGRVLLLEGGSIPEMLEDCSPFMMVPSDDGVHRLSLEIPLGYTGWYKFGLLQDADPRALREHDARVRILSEATPDPLNPHRSQMAGGSSVLEVPAWAHPAWHPEVGEKRTAGRDFAEWELEDGRSVWSFSVGASETVYVLLDGDGWMDEGFCPEVAERAGLRGLFVLISSGSGSDRVRDMHDPHRMAELLSSSLEVVGAGGAIPVVVGQSFGGVGALLLALHHPSLLRSAIVQSPSVFFVPGATSQDQTVMGAIERDLEIAGARTPPIRLSVGTREQALTSLVEQCADRLAERAPSVKFVRVPGGHNYVSWRSDLLFALAGC